MVTREEILDGVLGPRLRRREQHRRPPRPEPADQAPERLSPSAVHRDGPRQGVPLHPDVLERGLERRATKRVGRLQGAGRHRRRRSAPASSTRGRPHRPPGRAHRHRGPVRGRATAEPALPGAVRARRPRARVRALDPAHHARARPRAARVPAAAAVRRRVRDAAARPADEPLADRPAVGRARAADDASSSPPWRRRSSPGSAGRPRSRSARSSPRPTRSRRPRCSGASACRASS